MVDTEYNTVKSPIDGTVFDIKPKTEGYVARGGTPLLKIVGVGDLVGKVRIPAKDIGFIKPGMPTEISIDTFPSNNFGVVDGSVKSIGSDALAEDQNRDIGYYFPAILKLDTQKLESRGTMFNLNSGMTIRANIKLRPVKYIELIIGNFKDKSKSLRSTGGKG